MSQCARPFCFQMGRSGCSNCLREGYCSGDCQKLDWKVHKKICKTLKKLSNQIQPFRDAGRVITEILLGLEGQNSRILVHLLSFAELQFGERTPGKDYREKGKDRIDNWIVEIDILYRICYSLVEIYDNDQSMSVLIQNNSMNPYVQKMIDLIKPWSSDDTSRIERMSTVQTNCILELSSRTDGKMASIHTARGEFSSAENLCKQALSSAKKYKPDGETKSLMLYNAFRMYCDIRIRQDDYSDASTFAEEAYNCVAIAYNPVHQEVQAAAGNLIDCLIQLGNFYDAERFAQVSLDNLKDPANGLNQMSEDVARGHHNLGNVILKQGGDLVKAERLVREASRIRAQLLGDPLCLGLTANILGQILVRQGNFEEAKKQYERFLAISQRHEGIDGVNTAIANESLGKYHSNMAEEQVTTEARRRCLRLAVPFFKEALRITTKLYGLAHRKSIDHASNMSSLTNELSEA
eukprot:CAMPEP_0119037562 /NCGR_PEP_ID=MMETSP1177-20130426/5992_1 /TAXON_ID=2985 /ORGANISM="Ochromonas sp, Strain CCMP1899" /LENGTH=464 /DNA_ID=CAMNT_0006999011 /DNA_START=34 /DNA_END=1428 /DNA_ORIENTATION=+